MRRAAIVVGLMAVVIGTGATPAPASKRSCAHKGFEPIVLGGEAQVWRARPGTEISCDRQTGFAYSLDPSVRGYKHILDPRRRTSTRFASYLTAGRWLLYVQRRSSTSRLLLRDTRSGVTSELASAHRAADIGPRVPLRDGSVVLLTSARSRLDRRLGGRRLLLSQRGARATVLANGADVGSIAATLGRDGRPVVYWMAADGSHSSVGDGSHSSVGPGSPTPAQQLPPCQPAGSRTLFANGRVHVLQIASAQALACDTATNVRRVLRSSTSVDPVLSDFKSNGTSLVYQETDINSARPHGSLQELDVATGARRQLDDLVFYQQIALADLLSDGSAAWQLVSFPPGPTIAQSINVWPKRSPRPSVIDTGFRDPRSTPADDIAARSLALAPDGTAYWRRGDNTVRTTTLVAP